MDINDLEKIKSVLIKIDNLNKLNLDENSRLFIKEISRDNNFLNDFIEKNGEDGLFIIINGILENLHNSYQNIIESKKYFREEDLKISKEIINEMFLNKKMLEDKKITLEVYADFISKNENFKNKIKEVEEFIENIEAIIGYFQPIKFDVREIKPEIKKFISDYETFFKENENNIKESALMKFEKYIEEIKEMEKLLEI